MVGHGPQPWQPQDIGDQEGADQFTSVNPARVMTGFNL
jgi:hypothetical protein